MYAMLDLHIKCRVRQACYEWQKQATLLQLIGYASC